MQTIAMMVAHQRDLFLVNHYRQSYLQGKASQTDYVNASLRYYNNWQKEST